MSSRTITLPDIGEITLYKRRSNRTIRLSMGDDGTVRVTLPYWVPYKAAERFALSKTEWIAQHQATRGLSALTHGQRVGKAHRLYFIANDDAQKVATRLGQGEIRVTHPTALTPEHGSLQQAARAASLRALRKEAQLLLPQRVRSLAAQTGHTYRSLTVKHLKTRWGSCSSRQEITLNIFLMQLPWHLIDYVILHELTHTVAMNHGADFWAELERHAPSAKQLRAEIRTHRAALLGQNLQ